MRKWRVGTFSMGMLLIFMGVLLLIGRIKNVSSINIILNWWPIIIIILGIEILVHVYFSREDQPRVKYDVFSIFFIIFILIASLGIYGGRLIIENVPGVKDLSVFGYYRNDSVFNKKVTIKPEGEKKLILRNSKGNVEVRSSSSGSLEVEAEIRIRNNDETYAQTIADSMMEVTKNGVINISTKAVGSSYNDKLQDIRVNYIVSVPQGMEISIENLNGRVQVSDVSANVDLRNNNGEIIVSNIVGSAEITSTNGRVEVTDLKGKVKIRNTNGDIQVDNIDGDVDVTNKYGSIELRNVYKDIKLSNSSGSIVFESNRLLEKNLTIENKDGRVNVTLPKEQMGNFKAIANNGRINNDINLNVVKSETKESLEQAIGNSSIELNIKVTNGNIDISGN